MRSLLQKVTRGQPPRRHVFVVTYGRSGSTLLMNILNSADGCLIRGENNNVLYHLYRSYTALVEARANHGRYAHEQTSAWWGIADIDTARYRQQIATLFVDSVLRPEPDDRVVGFKEIRFSREDIPDLGDFLQFLYSTFEDARIVVNHRKLSDVANSKWWRRDENSIHRLEEIDSRLWSLNDPARVFHFEYDQALVDRGHIERMFDWLGLPYDQQRVDEVMETRHSY